MLVLTAWSDSGHSSRVYAVAGTKVDRPRVLGADRPQRGGQGGCSSAAPTWSRTPRPRCRPTRHSDGCVPRFGVSSLLRVPLPLGTHVFGSLFFVVARREPVQRRRHRLRRAAWPTTWRWRCRTRSSPTPRDATKRRARRRRGSRRRWPRSRRELEARSGVRRVVGPVAPLEGRAGPGHARGADRDHGAADRRVGHRQGSGRALHPPRLAPQRRPVHAPSTARPCPISCSSPSSSATSAARSPAP